MTNFVQLWPEKAVYNTKIIVINQEFYFYRTSRRAYVPNYYR